jgi:hypothetical protein
VVVNSGSICAGGSFVINPTGAGTYTISGGSATVTPTVTTTYSITGVNSTGCISDQALSNVTVSPVPSITAAINPTLLCKGTSATLSAGGVSTYTWSAPVPTSQIVSPTVTTTYSVTGSSSVGCQNKATVTESVINCAGIDEQSTQKMIHIFPNPSDGEITVEFLTPSSVQLVDQLGRIVIHEGDLKIRHDLSIRFLAPGVYYVKSGRIIEKMIKLE